MVADPKISYVTWSGVIDVSVSRCRDRNPEDTLARVVCSVVAPPVIQVIDGALETENIQ